VGPGIVFGGQDGNEALNNTTTGNATYGIAFTRDATAGYVEGNTSLNNATTDIYAKTGVTVTGDHNTCDTTSNYDDASAGAGNGCQYSSSNPPPEVPTANEWGLAFMIVLLLTAGLYTMRRRNQE
jgi:FlaG/FlaF family flagellin (archaellin)